LKTIKLHINIKIFKIYSWPNYDEYTIPVLNIGQNMFLKVKIPYISIIIMSRQTCTCPDMSYHVQTMSDCHMLF